MGVLVTDANAFTSLILIRFCVARQFSNGFRLRSLCSTEMRCCFVAAFGSIFSLSSSIVIICFLLRRHCRHVLCLSCFVFLFHSWHSEH